MKDSLRIGFDAKRLYNNFTGLGNYSRSLVENLLTYHPQNTYHLFTPKVLANAETLPFLEHPRLQTHLPNAAIKSYWRSVSIKKDLLQQDIQIYHGLSHELPLGIHKTGIKSFVTIHDLIIKRYPEYFSFPNLQIYDWKFRYACEHADTIIAISESTKKDIVEFYNIPAEKIEIIYQTCHERFKTLRSKEKLQEISEKYQLPSTYMLYVGSIIPRKNLLAIIRAMVLLPPELQLPLVAIGNGKNYKKLVIESINKNQLTPKIQFLQPHYEDLPAIYQQANLLLYPSSYEGFGIPILEALYSKIPVITAQNSSLPEAGGGGAHYVDTVDGIALAEAIQLLLTDEAYAQQLIVKGQQHLEKFDSKLLSEQLITLYSQEDVDVDRVSGKGMYPTEKNEVLRSKND